MTETPEDLSNSTPKQLWQAQNTESVPMALDQIHKRAQNFQQSILWRGILNFVIGAAEVCGFFYLAVTRNDTLERASFLLILMGILFILFVWFSRNGLGRHKAVAVASAACAEFHKQALTRSIKANRTAWAWLVLPILPGFGLRAYQLQLQIMRLHTSGKVSTTDLDHRLLFVCIGIVAWIAAVLWMSERRARKLTIELKQLG